MADSDSDEVNEFTSIVIDGANVAHDNDSVDSNLRGKIVPERLLAAIDHCELKGWPEIHVFMKRGTYDFATHPDNQDSVVGDATILVDLVESGTMGLIESKSEDIYWLEYGLMNSSYFITNDTFEDKAILSENGEKKTIPRERTKYPHLDWRRIDDSVVRYQFLKGSIQAPSLPKFNGGGSSGSRPQPLSDKERSIFIRIADRLFGYHPPQTNDCDSESKEVGQTDEKGQYSTSDRGDTAPSNIVPEPVESDDEPESVNPSSTVDEDVTSEGSHLLSEEDDEVVCEPVTPSVSKSGGGKGKRPLKKGSRSLNKEAMRLKKKRDEYNRLTPQYVSQRDEIQERRKSLFDEAESFRQQRDTLNSEVRELKQARTRLNERINSLKARLNEEPS